MPIGLVPVAISRTSWVGSEMPASLLAVRCQLVGIEMPFFFCYRLHPGNAYRDSTGCVHGRPCFCWMPRNAYRACTGCNIRASWVAVSCRLWCVRLVVIRCDSLGVDLMRASVRVDGADGLVCCARVDGAADDMWCQRDLCSGRWVLCPRLTLRSRDLMHPRRFLASASVLQTT
jgi:hypothetical protein